MAKYQRQYAALPIRMGDSGTEVMLVTSRSSRRWIIPKGWPEKRLAPRVVAAMEAFEEAGMRDPIAYRTRMACSVEIWKDGR